MNTAATQNAFLDQPHRLKAAQRIVDDVMTRRDRGEYVPDEQVIEANRELMPELAEELAILRGIQLAALAAQNAGPSTSPPIVPQERLSDPVTEAANSDPGDMPRPTIRGYCLLERISQGGQACVYKAIQERTNRKVAIKVMLGGRYANSPSRHRFEQETRILAKLSHPQIISVLDADRASDGSFFLVMPFIDGCGLDDYFSLHEGNHPEAVRHKLSVFVKIADAVGEAHRHGIVHRDLKPSNIRVDSRGEPWVLDFGLARVLQPDGLGRVQALTLAGQMVGSVPWFSPEQASGLKVDQRSDVYALGVMMYKAFTGRFPYPVVGAFRDVLNDIVTTVPPPLTDDLAAYPQAPALDKIVQRALAKAGEARYPSAADLADDLRQLLANPVKLIAAEPPAPHRRRWRNAGLAGLGFCVAIVATVALESRPGHPHAAKAMTPAAPRLATVPVPAANALFTNSVGIQLSQVPSGSFVMGSPPDEPGRGNDELQHSVTISRSFWIAVRPTTIRQYKAVMGRAPEQAGSRNDDQSAAPVSWSEADDFCQALSQREHRTYRLPTEAEWEYACRGGDHPSPRQSPANPPSKPAGVWEWCSDWYDRYPPQPAIDPQGSPASYQKVIRGGAIDAAFRPARRNAVAPKTRQGVGFRVLLEPTGQPPAAPLP